MVSSAGSSAPEQFLEFRGGKRELVGRVAVEAGRELVVAIAGLHVEVAVEVDAIGRVGDEPVPLLNEVRIVAAAIDNNQQMPFMMGCAIAVDLFMKTCVPTWS